MLKEFNPNNVSVSNGNYFALPFSPQESKLVLLSVPWDVTTSYRPGCAKAPDAIIEASEYIDLYDEDFGNAFEKGIGTLPLNDTLLELNDSIRKYAERVIVHLEDGGEQCDPEIARSLKKVNDASAEMNNYVFRSSIEQLNQGKIVGLVGGDHSTPFGLVSALGTKYPDFGILHIDAHADLRVAYEGFTYSHASIMNNILERVPSVSKLVQVGIRDFCEEEFNKINNDDRIVTFFDNRLSQRIFEGDNWSAIASDIIAQLPQKVYISFDIDGLESIYCPNTGTPVPGGLSYRQATYLIAQLAKSGKEIIGFDLNEVGDCTSTDWDANVGSRVVYKLACATLVNNQPLSEK